MDLASFKEKLEKSREVEAKVAGATFRLRVPTEHAWRVASEEYRSPNGRVKQQMVARSLLEGAIVGWEGVTEDFFLQNAGTDEVPFNGEMRAALLDERQDVADQLAKLVMAKMNERRTQLEKTRKNSARASSGTSTESPAARSDS